jgi:retron-type reverse transcriptase
VILHELK